MRSGEKAHDDRLEIAAELAVRIAAGNLDARARASAHGDAIDAVITALNMLAEELQHERSSRQRAEELLQDEIDGYENAPALFCSVDAASLIVEKCNLTLTAALGKPKEEILGASVLELYQAQYRGIAERALRDVPLGTSSDRAEAQLQTAGGGSVVVSTSATRVRGADGRDRLRIVWRDVTAERRLEAQLFQAQKLEAIGRLSSGVAHDFNNILSVISGATALLGDLVAAHAMESEDITLIQQAVARGASLTSDLLAFSRNRVVEPIVTDVRSVMREAERMITRLVGENVQVTAAPCPVPLHVSIDPSQLSQVLINLAINARDAMGSSGQLRIAARRVERISGPESLDLPAGPLAWISVSDDGHGMAPEIMARAFDPFFTTKPVGRGSGLGLSTCYGIIQQAAGRIKLESEIGKGTTVHVILPLAAAETRALPPVRSEPPARGKETILVVEDDDTVRLVTRRILERGGYHVIAARDGRQALEEVERPGRNIDLIVTDVTMPRMGGAELGSELRSRRPGTRILYLSGYTSNVTLGRGGASDNAEFLSKPFTQSALLERVRRVLDAR